jgi:hypothetical protein
MQAHNVKLLVSLPDRAGLDAPRALHPHVFAADVSRKLLLLSPRYDFGFDFVNTWYSCGIGFVNKWYKSARGKDVV